MSYDPERGPIRVFVENLGRHNEGDMVGDWVTLPVDDINATVKSVAQLDAEHEEPFITDWETPAWVPDGVICEYSNLKSLNTLAELAIAYDAADHEDEIVAFMEAFDLPSKDDPILDLANIIRLADDGTLPVREYDIPQSAYATSNEERFALTCANTSGLYDAVNDLSFSLADAVDWTEVYCGDICDVHLTDNGYVDLCADVDTREHYSDMGEATEDAEAIREAELSGRQPSPSVADAVSMRGPSPDGPHRQSADKEER